MRISSYDIDGMTGSPPAWRNRVEVRERVGTDGYTFIRQGKRSTQFTVQTRDFRSSMSDARARARDYERLCGGFVSMVDASGREYSRIMVLDVTAAARPLLGSTGGHGAVVEAKWTMQRGG